MEQVTSPGFRLFSIYDDGESEHYDVVARGVKAILDQLGPVRLGYIDQVGPEGMTLWVYELSEVYRALELTLDQDVNQFAAWELDMHVRHILDMLTIQADDRPTPTTFTELKACYLEAPLTPEFYLPELWELLDENSSIITHDNQHTFSYRGHRCTVTLMKAYTIWDFEADPDPDSNP